MVYDSTDTTTFTKVKGKGERAVREWETCISDGRDGDQRWMRPETQGILANAFRDDMDFTRIALLAASHQTMSHTTLMGSYHVDLTTWQDNDTFTINTKYGEPVTVTSPVWKSSPNVRSLPNPFDRDHMDYDKSRVELLDADMRCIGTHDPTDKILQSHVLAVRAYFAWLCDDLDSMRTLITQACNIMPDVNASRDAGYPVSYDALTNMISSLYLMRVKDESFAQWKRDWELQQMRRMGRADMELQRMTDEATRQMTVHEEAWKQWDPDFHQLINAGMGKNSSEQPLKLTVPEFHMS